MTHEWSAGVLTSSSWHGMETVQAMETAGDLIRAGESSGAFPTNITLESMTTSTGLPVPGSAVVADYQGGKRVAHSAVGKRYTPLDPTQWRETIRACVMAGAKPSGAFSLREGSRVLATFEIGGGGEGIANYICLVDSLDGSLRFSAGGTSVRVVCANTLQASFNEDGDGYAQIRHTKSINDRSAMLRKAIEAHVGRGEAISKLYKEAKKAELSRPDAMKIMEMLFPSPVEGDSKRLATRKINTRAEAAASMNREENNEGATVATIWNAATWLIDRDSKGNAKSARGGADKLDSLLFGSRSKRVEHVRNVIKVVLADGTVSDMEAPDARKHGVDDAQIGRSMLDAMLS